MASSRTSTTLHLKSTSVEYYNMPPVTVYKYFFRLTTVCSNQRSAFFWLASMALASILWTLIPATQVGNNASIPWARTNVITVPSDSSGLPLHPRNVRDDKYLCWPYGDQAPHHSTLTEVRWSENRINSVISYFCIIGATCASIVSMMPLNDS